MEIDEIRVPAQTQIDELKKKVKILESIVVLNPKQPCDKCGKESNSYDLFYYNNKTRFCLKCYKEQVQIDELEERIKFLESENTKLNKIIRQIEKLLNTNEM